MTTQDRPSTDPFAVPGQQQARRDRPARTRATPPGEAPEAHPDLMSQPPASTSPSASAGPRRCRGTSKRTRKQCGQVPPEGQVVCKWHGGDAPQVKAKAAERALELQARRTFGALGDHRVPIDNPFDALARTVGEVVAWKDFCAGRIAELEHMRSVDEKGAEQINAMVSLFERSLDRAVSSLAAISKLGIEERLARVTERQADAVVRAVEAGLAEAGVTGARVADAKRVVARELRVLPGGRAAS